MPLTDHQRDLLEPTLAHAPPTRPLYSPRAGFFVAFFGGPFAAVGLGALNSRRIGKLQRERWLLLALALLWAVLFSALQSPHVAGLLPAWLTTPRSVRYATQIAGLACYGLIHQLHKQAQAAAALRDQPAPSAWLPGLATVVSAWALTFVLAVVVRRG